MRQLKVLVVDDEALARLRLRTLLGDCSAPAAVVGAEAADAVQAMRALAHEHFDLVLLDIHMPGTSGMSLAQDIAKLPRPPAVVFVTAHAGHAVQAFDLAALDYLTKPVRLKYITVRTAGRSFILDGSLNELEERHPGYFMRIHRNALIARRAVRALEKHFDPEEGEGWAVRLNGIDELLAVSRRQLGAVREAIVG